MTKDTSWQATFKNAFAGLNYALRTQRNFKVHLIFSILVISLGVWLKIDNGRFLFLVLSIVLGLVVEMGNTAFEATVDLITRDYHPQAKIAKDVSAGMMLVASFGLALLGALILGPSLWQKLFA
ncbi:diacylglycerol kinase [Candidatus Shapirobacteria bacterium CG10_big_fil_rev_8_21_14_0_10_48_15]|uniref:Diacylglycerol kinase n=1 Tax=Candidatus Shapirobacteria bacterium CG10_big_fil_rev_8_21_14_0_10_48_15 TaxID=1974484 RepID=A0A2M8L803_9BACT|nr:MAG: diacylglycerol kinase [Candidatus Shapirobacteria bacterium CG10_big_fil_rev_8_21_14_0_10_48_15]